jgi:lipoyl(octanoyl) transferase
MRQYSAAWRLIDDDPMPGARNMAVDEAIARAVGRGDAPPTLRLYRWHPACLSLGYGQRASVVDAGRLASCGWDVVRRPTGGGAIFHTDELTYSIALPLDHPLAAGDIVSSYRVLSEALVLALNQVGAAVARHELDGHPEATTVCFETPSHYEITVDGRKLVGSAQARRYNALLQHGSLPLRGDLSRICLALHYESEDAREAAQRSVLSRAITLSEALGGRPVDDRLVAQAVVDGFTTLFGMPPMAGTLSDDERAAAEHLEQSQYGAAAWTARR